MFLCGWGYHPDSSIVETSQIVSFDLFGMFDSMKYAYYNSGVLVPWLMNLGYALCMASCDLMVGLLDWVNHYDDSASTAGAIPLGLAFLIIVPTISLVNAWTNFRKTGFHALVESLKKPKAQVIANTLQNTLAVVCNMAATIGIPCGGESIVQWGCTGSLPRR